MRECVECDPRPPLEGARGPRHAQVMAQSTAVRVPSASTKKYMYLYISTLKYNHAPQVDLNLHVPSGTKFSSTVLKKYKLVQ